MNENIANLERGEVLDNESLCGVFFCSPQGGMRRSKRTNTLVIVSNHVRSIYQDRWVDDTIHYTGMGTVGDQRVDSTQNKTLAESPSNGVKVHLFEVFVDKEYTYAGEVLLSGSPYQETQPDENGDLRKVWMFPLKLKSGEPLQVPEPIARKNAANLERQARKLSDAELKKRAKCSSRKPGTRVNSVKVLERSPWVSEYAKRWALGVCQLCGSLAPFLDKHGTPFLESHHIEWLSRDGDDAIENTIALCPNCHRSMHVLDREEDRAILVIKLNEHLASAEGFIAARNEQA